MLELEHAAESGLSSWSLVDKERIAIGRSPSCDLVIDDPHVSRVHALLLSHQGQRLIQDAGSRNGTYLDAVKLAPGEAVALREGDIIDLGPRRMVYDRIHTFGPAELLWTPPAHPEGDAGRWPVIELLREGHARLDLVQRVALQVAIDQATLGAGRSQGLSRALELLARCLPASAAVALLEDSAGILRPVATHPGPDARLWLLPLAHGAWAEQEGRLQLCWSGAPSSDTSTIGLESAAAVPFGGRAGGGVLAVRRSGGPRFDRSDLQVLAVAGERIALGLSQRSSARR